MSFLPLRALALIAAFVSFSSCQKESSFETATPGTGAPGSGNTGGNNTAGCNNSKMKLKRWQATFETNHFIEASWNADGTIHSLNVNVQFSEYRTARYVYANGRIAEAILSSNINNNQIVDTAVFRYNADGKVDSMFLKNDDYFNMKLDYNNGKLVKYTRYYASNAVLFYWTIVSDANDNVIKADEYYSNSTGGFDKISTFNYTRDNRKNPFDGLAQYMLYLDEGYSNFWYWGKNNYTNQRYQDFGTTGVDITTGYKFKYNDNCYPLSSQLTIMERILLPPSDDFLFTYY